jgi:hypothetical protein
MAEPGSPNLWEREIGFCERLEEQLMFVSDQDDTGTMTNFVLVDLKTGQDAWAQRPGRPGHGSDRDAPWSCSTP